MYSGVMAISGTCAIAVGVLKCWGDNTFGKLGIDPGWTPVDAGASFFVPARPSAPSIRKVVPGDSSVSVVFVPPSSDGGSFIVRTEVTCSLLRRDTSRSAFGDRSPIVVSALANGNEYACTARATNAVGTSVMSAPSRTFVPKAPSKEPGHAPPTSSRDRTRLRF